MPLLQIPTDVYIEKEKSLMRGKMGRQGMKEFNGDFTCVTAKVPHCVTDLGVQGQHHPHPRPHGFP